MMTDTSQLEKELQNRRYMAKVWLDEWLEAHDILLAVDAYDELVEALIYKRP